MLAMRPPPIRPELPSRLAGYEAHEETIGRSGVGVFRLYAGDRPTLIAKVSSDYDIADLSAEAARLKWLRSAGILAPQVLHVTEARPNSWLVMACLTGDNATTSADPPAVKVDQFASALRAIHALDASTCPFDETLAVKLARAKIRMVSHQVDETDFDNENRGRTPSELFRELERLRPATEDIVVAHGDACLPNIMLDRGCFSGFVDCGRLGRSDRYHDLALACRSISCNLGDEWVEPFLRAYGVTALDAKRARFYRLLDEFF